MLERIIQWSVDNRWLVTLAALFIAAAGALSLSRAHIDAIPDLSDVQVIVYTEYPGQAPRIVEDQVTYPLTTQLLAAPFARVVRGYSFFGYSFVLRHLRGRHRSVLGPGQGARVPEPCGPHSCRPG